MNMTEQKKESRKISAKSTHLKPAEIKKESKQALKTTGLLFLAVVILLIFVYFVIMKQEEDSQNFNTGNNNSVLLKVEDKGGQCSYGACYSQIFINNNGSYLYKEGNGDELKGAFSKNEIDELGKLIKEANFNFIKSKKFTGLCPTAYDGSELIYTFYPQNEIISSCEFEIDENSPLFKLIGKLLDKIYLVLSLRV